MLRINNKSYDYLESFLSYFDPMWKSDDEGYALEEDHCIKEFVENPHKKTESIKRLIQEAKEVLEIKPFPWDFIRSSSNRAVWNEKIQDYDNRDPESYHQWLTMVTDMLETEAKRQGKL
jgi:hypothetical protein